MKLRIKEICKSKGITLASLAKKMNISPESLSRQINGNPTIAWLEKTANALEVDFIELFPVPENKINGFLEIDNDIHKISSANDLLRIANNLNNPQKQR